MVLSARSSRQNVSAGQFGGSTTFLSCQSLAIGAISGCCLANTVQMHQPANLACRALRDEGGSDAQDSDYRCRDRGSHVRRSADMAGLRANGAGTRGSGRHVQEFHPDRKGRLRPASRRVLRSVASQGLRSLSLLVRALLIARAFCGCRDVQARIRHACLPSQSFERGDGATAPTSAGTPYRQAPRAVWRLCRDRRRSGSECLGCRSARRSKALRRH